MSKRKYPPAWDGYYPCDRRKWEIMVAWISEGCPPPVPREVVEMHLRHLSTAGKTIPSRAALRTDTGVSDKRVRGALSAEEVWKLERAKQGPSKGQPGANSDEEESGESSSEGQPGSKGSPKEGHTRVGRDRDSEIRDNSKNSYVLDLWLRLPESKRQSASSTRVCLVSAVANCESHEPLATDEEIASMLVHWHDGEPFGVHVVRAAREVLANLGELEAEDRRALREACTAMWDPGGLIERLGAA